MKAFWIFLFSATALADVPTELGTFEGVLYTGAALRQSFTFRSGSLSQCEVEASTGYDVHKCAVTDGRIEVVGGETFRLTDVAMLKYPAGVTHQYYKGTRNFRLGDREITQAVSVTVVLDPKDKSHLSGYLNLRDLDIRSGFDAFKKN